MLYNTKFPGSLPLTMNLIQLLSCRSSLICADNSSFCPAEHVETYSNPIATICTPTLSVTVAWIIAAIILGSQLNPQIVVLLFFTANIDIVRIVRWLDGVGAF